MLVYVSSRFTVNPPPPAPFFVHVGVSFAKICVLLAYLHRACLCLFSNDQNCNTQDPLRQRFGPGS